MNNHYTFKRNRRLRSSAALRSLVRETELSVTDFIYPLFVVEDYDIKREIPSMPGIYQWSLDRLEAEIHEISALGIQAVLLFGIPVKKDELGTEAYAKDGIVQQAIRLIKRVAPHLLVIADNCLCEYTSHGHCGVIVDNDVCNDQSIELMAKTAVSQAKAGADMIAPSSMLDGFVSVLRQALNEHGFTQVSIMSYAVKFASAFYGPFRDAAESEPQFGDRKTYQMDFANRREAWREAATDIEEGADCLIVKPAMAYLDIVSDVSERSNLPTIAYNVSGEYSMVKQVALKGLMDEQELVFEKLIAMKRAGAQMIISYHAKDVAKWLKE